MSVETKPNKLVKGLVLDTFHTDVDNTVATYALNSQLEDQEGNHFHYGSEVGTTFIKNIPDTHVVVGHINMERNETVLFTTDGTNSTIGILSRNDDMSYQYEIKVDDTKQTKKLGFKKNIYIRGVYRLLNGCDKVIYFVDGVNKDRRINLNQLDSYKLPTTVTSAILFVVTAIIRSTSTLTADIKIIRVLSPTNIFTQSNVVANLIRAVNFQSNLFTSSSLVGDINFVQKVSSNISSNSLLVSNINFVQKVASSLNANALLSGDISFVKNADANLSALASLTGDISFVQKAQASLLTSASVTGNITIPKTFNASLLATGTTTADLTVNTPSASLLLDLYPNAAAAYSLRKLRTAYSGSAIRVRRSIIPSGQPSEQDIGFVAGQLDTVSLLAFCGAGNGFVTTWYDQSGNGRNTVQTTAANQPQIVSSGSVLVKNSLPCVEFTSSHELLSPTNFDLIFTNSSLFGVMQMKTPPTSVLHFGWGKSNNALKIRFFYNINNRLGFAIWTNDANGTISILDTTISQYTGIQTTNAVLSKDATTQTVPFLTTPLTTDNGSFGINGIAGTNLRGTLSFTEGIFYTSDKSSDASGIKLNQKLYYGTA